MARGINKVILVGNLGADPETRYSTSGSAVTNLRLATTDSWKDRQTGEQQERTEWHRVVCFNRLGEIAAEYLRKGSQIYIEGRIQTRKWQGQDGQDRYTTEIVASEMQMLGSRGGDASSSRAPRDDGGARAPRDDGGARAPRDDSGRAPARQPAAAAAPPPDDFDDDIPF